MSSVDILAATYGHGQVCTKLGVSTKALRHYRNLGLIPHVGGGQHVRYPCDFIDGLAPKLRVSRFSKSIDDDLIALYRLHYQFKHPPAGLNNTQRARFSAVLQEQCEEMVERGRVVRLDNLFEALSDCVAPKTILTWAQRNRIATASVRGVHYLSVYHYSRIVDVIRRHITLGEAAARTGLHPTTIRRYVRQGKLWTVKGPDDVLRLNPNALNLIAEMPQDVISLGEAANLLQVSDCVLRRELRQGRVIGYNVRGAYYMPRDEVYRWRDSFTTLNPGFEWLDWQVKFSERRLSCCNTARARKLVGVSEAAFSGWCVEDLLPYYLRSFCDSKTPSRYYVYLYAFGLARFMNGEPSIQKAREYKKLCAEARAII